MKEVSVGDNLRNFTDLRQTLTTYQYELLIELFGEHRGQQVLIVEPVFAVEALDHVVFD